MKYEETKESGGDCSTSTDVGEPTAQSFGFEGRIETAEKLGAETGQRNTE